jgi:hypothetical protein
MKPSYISHDLCFIPKVLQQEESEKYKLALKYL